MKREKLIKRLKAKKPLLADGAMGTLLHERGVGFDQCFDELNLTNPSLVADIHREYIEAGSEIILTNTFGANRYKLSRHGLEDKVTAINNAGVELTRRVVLASFKEIFIAGDVGPLGVRLAPFGRVQPEQARDIFKEQINALYESDVDLLVIETITDLYEIREAISAAQSLNADIPIVASMTFTRDDCTLLGDNPIKVVNTISNYGADVIGVNCSGGPNQLLRLLKKMHQALPEGIFWIKPNAGWPEQVSGRIFYPASPEYFGNYALAFWKRGAKIMGGCCGTTPAHIAAMDKAIQSNTTKVIFNDLEIKTVEAEVLKEEAQEPTKFSQKLTQGKFIFTIEMDPPRGLSTHKILAGASLLAEAGADAIDIADSPMARMRMSPWAICNLIQKHINIETVLHFPTRGRNLLRVQGDLLAAHALGVRNVFVVMGDPTAIGDYPEAMDNYDLAPSGLIKLIKQRFNQGIDHAGSEIGQPTSFFVGCALNLAAPDPEREMKVLQRKIRKGTDFILTQPIYDVTILENFLKQYRVFSKKIEVPIIIGVLPLVSAQHAAFLHQEVPGIDIPEKVYQQLQSSGDEGAKLGIKQAIDLIHQLKQVAQGVYLMPAFSRFDYAAEIIDKCSG
ncbi:MAG TPA: bifunctional homocysteine S-methyltransferase/methylenetetrahydrofolate reductase [Anaerolineae bacterium]|nr:bifunctional homocysteine S-methyltransferase/methylenetetrahydrofolate reductase [Anaerolineae bacterium]